MQYRYLGRTGLKVSELCLGAMTFGRETPEELSYPMLDRFVAAGGNFIYHFTRQYENGAGQAVCPG